MKLRIRGNTVRLRLLRNEVEDFSKHGRIAETIEFGPTEEESLTYALQSSEVADSVRAGYCENEICVVIPQKDAERWTETEEVGLSATYERNGTAVEILIEKDFVCLTRTDDPDNENAYPNPEAEEC